MAHQGGFCTSSRVKATVLVLALALAIYVAVPPLFKQILRRSSSSSSSSSRSVDASGDCAPCTCDCNSPLSDSVRSPVSDCIKTLPALHKEVDVNSLDLLFEELKLKENASEAKHEHAESVLLDAKKVASQYQKEAEKCSAGMETCDQAREKFETALVAEKKITATWEQRAKELGWKDPTEDIKQKGLAGHEEEIKASDDSAFYR